MTPCTRADIKRIESATDLPGDIRIRRIALCVAVAFGLDPVYVDYQLHIAPSDCGIEVEDLKLLNPGWVDLIHTMNKQLTERPPKWHLEGGR